MGFGRYSGKWSLIQKDLTLGLGHRRSTDLRDRFRNAFPDKYVSAGFKPPPTKKRRRTADEAEPGATMVENTLNKVLEENSREQLSFPIVDEAMVVVGPVQEGREPATEVGFTNTRLPAATTSTSWSTSPANAARAKEAEMVAKLRAALDMESALGNAGEIPLDPGLNDVAYQPHGDGGDAEALTEALTGLIHAASSQHRN
jgi:hypothetical protein